MAVVNNKKNEQATSYTGLQGVSQNTANNLGKYQQGYTQSDAVTAAQNSLAQVQANKPQAYASKYTGALDNILAQIQNPQEFRYEFNADNLFKNYADLYTQKGKQASLDNMAQAAALTGGYGNSYAQNAGLQGYQQYLLSLYDVGLDLRDRAYQQHQDQLANNYNIYNTLYNADQADYGKYRDTVADWQTDRDYYYNNYVNERNFDYNDFSNMLNYWNGLASNEYNAYLAQQQLAADQAAEDRKYAYNYAMSILANGQMPSDALLASAGLSREDAQRMMAQMIPAGGGGSGGSGGRSSGQQVAVVDANGQFYVADKNGNAMPISREEVATGNYLIDTSLAGAESLGYASGLRTANVLNDRKNTINSVAANMAKTSADSNAAYAEKIKKQFEKAGSKLTKNQ